ncbi:hypothetical protein CICLE_v10002938mg [Citrus x clementina]|uniref:Uncharacterized protein n=1 Tax=Citrus clementina TaxID=85681 RepID=V4SC92_CITCL|nr:hypothetical protein CICLE_v10002938mg [Citrus x clementina]
MTPVAAARRVKVTEFLGFWVWLQWFSTVEKRSSVWVVWGRLFALVGRCEPGSEAMVAELKIAGCSKWVASVIAKEVAAAVGLFYVVGRDLYVVFAGCSE